jgi:hypothetical protein
MGGNDLGFGEPLWSVQVVSLYGQCRYLCDLKRTSGKQVYEKPFFKNDVKM